MKYILTVLILLPTFAQADMWIQKPIQLPTEQEYQKASDEVVQSIVGEWCGLRQSTPKKGQIQIRWIRRGNVCVSSYIVGK